MTLIRRSLRIGIRLGLVGGLVFAVFKIVQARRPSPALPEGGEDAWGPPPARPAAAPSRPPPGPALVEPTMLDTTSRPARGAAPGEPSPAPVGTSPADATLESVAAELDDEIAILSSEPEPTVAPPMPVAPPAPAPEPASGARSAATAPQAGATSRPGRQDGARRPGRQDGARRPGRQDGARRPGRQDGARRAQSQDGARPAKASGRGAAATKKAAATPAWVEPTGGVCPTTHPVKGKLKSRIFHLPGMVAYERTSADRCYRDPAAAESEGLRRAKR